MSFRPGSSGAIVYERARRRHPEHWTRGTRDWSRVEEVLLSPDRRGGYPEAAGRPIRSVQRDTSGDNYLDTHRTAF